MDTIEGYQVKPEFIPMLRKILSKHGDVMEMFLRIPWYSQRYSELQDKGLDKITEDELRNMFGVANEIKNMKVNTEWLFLRLEEILEARQILGQSGILKEEKDNNRKKECEAEKKAVEAKFRLICDKIRCKEIASKEKLAREEDESARISETTMNAKSKIRRFVNYSSADGLF
uniref:Uncharacterized protein n=1 Tax=Glycine max TaxID=3847 RepID=A0A0R0KB91_SOYBN